MLPLPAGLNLQFQAVLDRKGVTRDKCLHYLKWLRYDPDCCVEYGFDPSHPETLPHFLDKLRQKKQTEARQEQMFEAISWFYERMAPSDGIAEALSTGAFGTAQAIKSAGIACFGASFARDGVVVL